MSGGGRGRRVLPLVIATAATQSSIVVLVPIVVAVGRDLGASVSAVGQARTVLAGSAVLATIAIARVIDRAGVRRVIVWGGSLAAAGALASGVSPSIPFFLAAQALTGLGVACLLSAGFAGVASYFSEGEAAWAMGYVVAAQSLAWIIGNPLIGVISEAASWRLAYLVPGAFAAAAVAAALVLAPPGGGADPDRRGGLAAVLGNRSARAWTVAELVAYAAWTAELTYAGAFYIETYGVGEATTGVLLAVGSLAFLVSTLNTRRLEGRVDRRVSIVIAALAMGGLLAVMMNVTPSVWFTLGVFCLLALSAGVRSTASSSLGLTQMPGRAGSMMAARTAAAQLGYMLGAAAGGAVLALSDFGVLGFVLFAGLGAAALLVMRVEDSRTPASSGALPAAVPD